MEIIPNFAVFEGGDGTGTTTQLLILSERLKQSGKLCFFPTFEPTNGQIGKIIRAALKKEAPITPQTLAMLFAADRNEHIYGPDGIFEHVNRGELVVSDRYVLSSLVYQGIECGDELPASLNSRFPAPEVLIFFDIEPEIAVERLKNRSSLEIYEYREFQAKACEKYKSLLGMYTDTGVRVETIDASKTAQEVAGRVWSIISQMPIFKA
ncbi:MAG: dTMP kinase [Treponema sp.]|jgi:dTMP kinase|nr:dTMP kinase [Treponema sp.]